MSFERIYLTGIAIAADHDEYNMKEMSLAGVGSGL